MSQKPKADAQTRTASTTKVTPKEVVMKAGPAKEQPVAETEPVKAAPAIESEPVNAEPTAQPEPVVETEPPVEAQPVIHEAPIVEAAPAAQPGSESTVGPSTPVSETIAAASDLAAASAKAASTSITATADTVAAVTAEAVETASLIKPTKPTITLGMKTMMKTTEDFVAFGQANLEAFVKSGQIWSAGVQELTKQIATSAKASFDESVSTFKAISTAKSVKEAMDLQSSFAKAALEKAMAESNKLTDASIKLTEQTLAPITARVTVAVETFGKAA
jgi:phasin family protein